MASWLDFIAQQFPGDINAMMMASPDVAPMTFPEGWMQQQPLNAAELGWLNREEGTPAAPRIRENMLVGGPVEQPIGDMAPGQPQGSLTPQQAAATPRASDPTRAIPQARAIQEEELRRRLAQQAGAAGVPRNPWDMFGAGGGDWASAWRDQMAPKQSIPGALIGNQLGAFLNYGKELNQTYNSPTGPYGQLQMAATMQRPYKAQENVAQIQAEADKYIADSKNKTALGLAGYLGGPFRGSPTSISTDYGASVTPTFTSIRGRR